MRITFSGDICASVPGQNISLDHSIASVFAGSDFNFACLEAPVLSNHLDGYKKIGPNLMQDKYSLDSLIGCFSHVSLANNHSMDYGAEGLQETMDYLDEMKVQGIGAGLSFPKMYEPAVIEKDGIRVAVFCWAEAQYGCSKSSEHGQGYAWMLHPMTYKLIQDYKKTCDYVILFLHAGLEDVDCPIIEWREQYRQYIDYGADLIVANHPHSIQGKECYRERFIYYSLGNLYFIGQYANDSQMWTNSILLECDISKEGISTKECFVHFSDSTIVPSQPDIEKHFIQLTGLLKPECYDEYKSIHDRMIMDCWNDYYKSYYSFPIWKIKPRVIFYRRWFNKLMYDYAHHCFLPPVSENKLYHNINIDTHRFVVSRVCSMLAETY